MYSVATLAALLSAAAAVSAQGRFPCSYLLNGVVTEQANMCQDGEIQTSNAYFDASTAGGPTAIDNGGYKIDGYAPVNSECVMDVFSGNYFCGYTGATCDTTGNGNTGTLCDNGNCVATGAGTAGTCQGSVGQTCTLDSQCLGYVYCLTQDSQETDSGVCGGVNSMSNTDNSGAFCDDGYISQGTYDGAIQAELDNLCVSSFCVTPYNEALWPGNAVVGECAVEQLSPSAKSRARRADISARGARCPASHTACSVPGSARGFECVDTTSNLEQCGGCAGAGGVDCTALPGVDAVGCVSGQCEIWACAEGFAWDASSASCTVSLVAN